MEWLKNFLIAVGGGATALIAVLTVFKSMFLKVFDKAIDTTFDKNLEKYRNKLVRSTTAYDYLLKKEMSFYEKLDPYMAELVPLVQDLAWSIKGENMEKHEQQKKFKEYLLQFVKVIPELKNDVVLHQPYIPEDIFHAAVSLINSMQKDLNFWKECSNILFNPADNSFSMDVTKAETISDSVLQNIALIEMLVKKRLSALIEPQ